ncbi:hypothetical protein Q0Z83_079570 [Actinoplanes sichuanensis]|nr:hypothetical protein Q0Z83_079570 [Actinoplanes sichuanensis]
MHAHVVADIDDRRHLRADGSGVSSHAEKETGTADAPGQDHDPHPPILPHPRRPLGWRVSVYSVPTSIHRTGSNCDHTTTA